MIKTKRRKKKDKKREKQDRNGKYNSKYIRKQTERVVSNKVIPDKEKKKDKL